MKKDNTIEAFFALLRAGLWEQEVRLSQYGDIDYNEIYRLAEEQSVVGLMAAGIEHVIDFKLPKDLVLEIVGESLQLEQRNTAMNHFIAGLIEKMRNADIYIILVKGQGIAQCYERPLWRACGDIDFLLSKENYNKSKEFLLPLASSVETENSFEKHLGMTISSWVVELHGSMRSLFLTKMDKEIDAVQDDVFYRGNVRTWINGETQVFLPGLDCNLFFVFTHIIKHFYKGGIGLRQICDWCRLMWVNKRDINKDVLYKHLKKAGIITEWKSFASVAVDYLGMPADAIPFYSPSRRWSYNARKIVSFVIETGNFGQNRDNSYRRKTSILLKKTISLVHHTSDYLHHFLIFPLDSIKVWGRMFMLGVNDIANKTLRK